MQKNADISKIKGTEVYFLKLHMGVYLRVKFEVSSIILTGFRQGVILHPPSTPQNEPLKSPPRLGLNHGLEMKDFCKITGNKTHY